MIEDGYIKSRVARSKEMIEEANVLFGMEHYLSVVNRLYYAVFYLACEAGIGTKTHSGTKTKFHETFVKTGQVDKIFGKLYDRLFTERSDSDYGDFEAITKEDAQSLLSETERVLNEYWKKFEEYRKNKLR